MTNQPIAVTGASGFLASYIIKKLLEQNYKVHGTVRSLADKDKYNFLLSFPNAQNLKLFEATLDQEGSFDAAFQGVEVVLHVASPVIFTANDPQKEIVDLAEFGTLNALRSANKAGVKRVVVTSSAAALADATEVKEGSNHFDENNWNTVSTAQLNPYYASKAKAEKAAFDFVKNNQPSFDIVTFCPPMILGEVYSPSLRSSVALLTGVLDKVKKGEAVSDGGFPYVHVDDLAKAHIDAGVSLGNKSISNQRYIVSEGSYSYGEVARRAVKLYPGDFGGNTAKVDGDETEGAKHRTFYLDNTKFKRDFPQIKLKSLDSMIKDTVDSLKVLNKF